MISDDSASVTWFVDPGSSYDEAWVLRLVKWLEDWDRPIVPSRRYFWLKESGVHFWGAHMFLLGLQTKADVDAFREVWGGFAGTGKVEDGKFVLDLPESYRDGLNWVRR